MLNRFTIKARLFASFSLLALLLLIVSAANFYSLKTMAKGSQEMYEANTQPLPHTGEIGILFERIRVNIRDAYMESDISERQKYFEKIQAIEKKIDEHMAEFKKTLSTKGEKEEFEHLRKELDLFYAFGNELAKLGGPNGDQQQGLALIREKCREMAASVEEELAGLMSTKAGQAKKLDDKIDLLARRSEILSLTLTIVGIVLAFAMGLLVSLSITKPINTMRDMLMDIAQGEGDLTKRLPEDGKDELAETSRWFNTFISKLSGIISETASLAERLANESTTLATTAEQMASGAEGVSIKSATLATAAEEMSATSHDIANNCHMAADNATMASETSQKGAGIAKATTEGIRYRIGQTRINAEAISQLGSRSDQIGEIVGTIEDIADQTNLLALNAAIEAARAGEMGRGFAVVADEVRALAERTTKATKEISDMIRAIQRDTKAAVDAMQAGVSTSQKAIDDSEALEKALAEIMDQVSSVTMQVSQIATAAEEQTATTHEISTNIQQSSITLEETASGAHQTARAASHLDSLAEQLKKLVGTFRW